MSNIFNLLPQRRTVIWGTSSLRRNEHALYTIQTPAGVARRLRLPRTGPGLDLGRYHHQDAFMCCEYPTKPYLGGCENCSGRAFIVLTTHQLPCFITSITEASCSLTDIQTLSSCVCTNHTLLTNVSGCVRLACDTPDQVGR